MSASLRHALYVAIAVAATIGAWWHGFAWIMEGGNILNLPSFFLDSYRSGNAAAFLTIDILAAWAVFLLWVVPDATRIGLGAKTGWVYFALSFVGTCFALPLYLRARERHLEHAVPSVG